MRRVREEDRGKEEHKRKKKLKSDTRARRDTIENKIRVKSKGVRGMSRYDRKEKGSVVGIRWKGEKEGRGA